MIPKTGGLNVSWVARALSGTPFTLVNNNGRSRTATASSPSRCRPAATRAPAPNAYTVDDYKAERNGAYGPGFFNLDMRVGYAFRFGVSAGSRSSATCST